MNASPASPRTKADGTPPAGPLVDAIDRWIYVFMAALLILVTLIGFIPDSLEQIAMVRSGARPPLPIELHVHAILMASFMILLLTQTTLAATGRIGAHMQLGVAAMLLVPALVVVGFILADTMYLDTNRAWQSADAGAQGDLAANLGQGENIFLIQLRIMLPFPLMLAIGLAARATDVGLHKRMMILGTTVALPPAIDRIEWLPSTLPTSVIAVELYTLALIAPMFAWDVFRTRSIHRAYRIWFAMTLPAALIVHFLWDTPWWHLVARQTLLLPGV